MILVFGNNGQIASSLKQKNFAREATFLGSDQVNFLRQQEITDALEKHKPKLIINTSAYTNVEKAQIERDQTRKVNSEAVGIIANWSKENNCSILHFSTDYTYPGNRNVSWTEDQVGGPLNWYGETKLMGERKILESGAHAVILKTSWVFSEYGNNFFKTMLNLGKLKKEIRVVDDQFGAPTYAADLSEFISLSLPKIISKEVSGVFNICNTGITTWFDFAEEIFQQARGTKKFSIVFDDLIRISSAEFKSAAIRPANSMLNTSKLENTFNFHMPSWQSAVTRCLANMEGDFGNR